MENNSTIISPLDAFIAQHGDSENRYAKLDVQANCIVARVFEKEGFHQRFECTISRRASSAMVQAVVAALGEAMREEGGAA